MVGPSLAQEPGNWVIILFSIHFVLKAEQLLKKEEIRHDVIPVPREISSDCGMAIEFSPDDYARVSEVLKNAQIEIARMYSRDGNGFREENWKK